MKKVLVSALFAAGMIGAMATPLSSVADVDIQLNFGPPAVRYESVPEPRRGYVWSPGHWQWGGNRDRHVWVAGSWQRVRPGYAYQAPGWVERGGRWHYQASRWDRDGDGTRNNRDSTPDGLNRSNDRDGDGIRNNRDSTPDGVNRSSDRDGDGIRNNRDSTPDGVNRSSDRDRDGVPDRRDAYPNNPNYR